MKPYIKTIQGLSLTIQCFGREVPFFFLTSKYIKRSVALSYILYVGIKIGTIIIYHCYRFHNQTYQLHERVFFDVLGVCCQILPVLDNYKSRLGFTSENVRRHNVCIGVLSSHFLRRRLSSWWCQRNTSRDHLIKKISKLTWALLYSYNFISTTYQSSWLVIT